jgi:hypothetical protein
MECFVSHSNHLLRPLNHHPRKGGDPAFFTPITFLVSWTPAFAGVTVFSVGHKPS